jgi:hypothetical protein
MKHEQHRLKRRAKTLDERFASDPQLSERIHQIADIRDELIAQGCSMDEVETQVVEQIRLLGKELLWGIAQQKSDQSTQQALQKDASLSRDSKKSNLADHPWKGCRNRTSAASGSSWYPISTILPSSRGEASWLFQTVGTGVKRLWGGRSISSSGPQDPGTLRYHGLQHSDSANHFAAW